MTEDNVMAGIFILAALCVFATFVAYVARGIRKNYLLEQEEETTVHTIFTDSNE